VTGAIRSQPYFEETGAVRDCEGGVKKQKMGGLRRHGIAYSLAVRVKVVVASFMQPTAE
jgi:hypothetical protein